MLLCILQLDDYISKIIVVILVELFQTTNNFMQLDKQTTVLKLLFVLMISSNYCRLYHYIIT